MFAGVNIVAHWQVSNLFVKAEFVSYFRWILNRSCTYRAVFTQKKRGICVWICTRGFTTKLSLSSGFHHHSVENGHLCGCSFSILLFTTTYNTQISSCLYSLTEAVMRYIATRVPQPKTSPYKNVKSVQKAKVCKQINLQYHVITTRNWQTWNMNGNGGKKRVVIICPQAMLPSSISSIAMATRFLKKLFFRVFRQTNCPHKRALYIYTPYLHEKYT